MPILAVDRAKIADYCRRHRIRRLALFGSFPRGGYNAESEIDILVEFEEGGAPGLFGIVAMEDELGEILGLDRKIDLRTLGDLSRHFRDEVSALAQEIYAAA